MAQDKTATELPAMGGREWAMLLALAVLWGGSFFFNAVAVRELPSFTLVWLRVAVAAVTLLGVLRLLGQRMPTEGRIWATFFGMGLLNNVVPFVLIVWGQHHIASGLASILNATTPLFTVLAAHLLTPDERLTPLKAAGVAMGFAGAVSMIGPDALGGLGTGVTAQIACLAGALSYAFAGIFGRRFKRMGVELRPTATYRKVTGGFRSNWGADLFAGVRSVVGTAARRGESAYQAIQQTLRGQAASYPG